MPVSNTTPAAHEHPTQIDAQVQNGINGSSVVVTGGRLRHAATIPLLRELIPCDQPSVVFCRNTSGCGQAVAYNVHADGGSVSLNTPRNSLDPEKDVGLTIFLTDAVGLDSTDRRDRIPSRIIAAIKLRLSHVPSLRVPTFNPNFRSTRIGGQRSRFIADKARTGHRIKVGIDQAKRKQLIAKGWPQRCSAIVADCWNGLSIVSATLKASLVATFNAFHVLRKWRCRHPAGGGGHHDPRG